MTPLKVTAAAIVKLNESTDSMFLLPARVLLFLLVLLAANAVFAQDTIPETAPPINGEIIDTIPDNDWAEPRGKFAVRSPYHSPMKATLLSSTVPGLGQAYNGKYWKIPFIYAGFGGVVYALNFNNERYQHFRRAWIAKIDGNPNTIDQYPNSSPERLQREMNRWRRNVEVSYIAGAALYILNVLDATVDAHLLDFDIGEDLTMNIMPAVLPTVSANGSQGKPVTGITLSFRF